MIIQDLIIMVGSALFSVALLPSVFSKNKPSWWTSLLTATVLGAFVWCYATLGLTYAAASTSATCALWTVLLYQKLWRRN